jgi:hypothetical protein
MKILLLKPISDVYYVIQPNLGLGYLAAIMTEQGHKVRILDAGREKLDWDQFTKLIKQEKSIPMRSGQPKDTLTL